MGLIAKLFGKSRARKSYVRDWAKRRRSELLHTDNMSIDVLFVAIISYLNFGKKLPNDSIPAGLRGLGVDPAEHYSGDEALFEIGCYYLFHLDSWLLSKEPHLRKELSTALTTRFLKLFSHALGTDNLPGIVRQRAKLYRELARTGADAKEFHFHLSQLVVRTRDNTLPATSYDPDRGPMVIVSLLESWGINGGLQALELIWIPTLHKAIEAYCASLESF